MDRMYEAWKRKVSVDNPERKRPQEKNQPRRREDNIKVGKMKK
jgi:hypothetical protein